MWTQEDFHQMGWHDSQIYKIRFSKEFELDIDYILKRNKPDLVGLPFTYWVVPSTLIFKEVKNIEFKIDSTPFSELQIEDIEREVKDGIEYWRIITRDGYFEFESSGYHQYMRQEPFFQFGQTIPYQERNGYSLEPTTNQDNPKRLMKEIAEQRVKNLEHYENVKKRHLKRQAKVKLEEQWLKKEITPKEYLKKKREIKEVIEFYSFCLEDTIFENW